MCRPFRSAYAPSPLVWLVQSATVCSPSHQSTVVTFHSRISPRSHRSTVDRDGGPLTDPLPPSYRNRVPLLPPTEGSDAMTGSTMSQELIDLRGRMRRFIDEEVIPAEPAF